MSEKRPNVFPVNTPDPKPQQNQIRIDRLADTPAHNVSTDNDYDKKKLEVASEVYSLNTEALVQTGSPMADAIEAMRKRTEEQVRLRNERLAEMNSNTQAYQKQYEAAKQRPVTPEPQKSVLMSEPKSVISNSSNTSYIDTISQPQYNAAFDIIPLPSEGKIYKNKKSKIKVAYMTTGDENIFTSPNLLESGEFLEIFLNRKILETDIRYKDLHIGDRNAIMLWLRATAYGEMYPVTLYDENDEPFETEIDLTQLKTKSLGVEPDDEGYFDFSLPVSKYQIKFKLLTVRDMEEIENLLDEDKKNEIPVNNLNTYRLEKQIIEINGHRDKGMIKDFVQTMRVGDSKALKDYINNIESGIDLMIEVETPRGGSIKTFLPLNFKFFWPNFGL
jgi:hypothetical protein